MTFVLITYLIFVISKFLYTFIATNKLQKDTVLKILKTFHVIVIILLLHN